MQPVLRCADIAARPSSRSCCVTIGPLPTRGISSPSGFLVRGHISMGKMGSGLGSTRPIAWAGWPASWERRLVPTYAVPEGLLLAPKYHFANEFHCGSPCRFCVFLVAFAPCREHHVTHRALRWVCAAPCGLTPNEVDSVLSGWYTGHHVTHPALGWMCGARGLIPNKVDSVLSRWYAGHHVTHPALGWMCAVPVGLSLTHSIQHSKIT